MSTFIHFGLCKTGTSFLQHEIFPKIPNINFLYAKNQGDILRFREKPHCINLISHEELSGKPYVTKNTDDIRFIVADRMKAMFPTAKALIGIRELDPWLRSCYKQSIIGGNDKSYSDWCNTINRDYWNIKAYLLHIKKLFPEVYVYTMHDFITDNERIIQEICSFLGTEVPPHKQKLVNRSLTDGQVKVLRFINHFLRSDNYNPNRKISQYPLSLIIRKLKR